ncbi:hypothetical protein C2E23DRAFT_471876 [Lenzites betulinus]|nr:hypothetical protein C2E23DRAFT_471876 [Lenzites betulinus]
MEFLQKLKAVKNAEHPFTLILGMEEKFQAVSEGTACRRAYDCTLAPSSPAGHAHAPLMARGTPMPMRPLPALPLPPCSIYLAATHHLRPCHHVRPQTLTTPTSRRTLAQT